jgi:mono/diheme cytochrome c family protein
MKRLATSTISVFLGLGFAVGASAGDVARGRLLYENHCMACHRSVVHIREDRKATTIEALRDQVRRWSGNAGLVWSDDEIEDVVLYLDSRFYHFVLNSR